VFLSRAISEGEKSAKDFKSDNSYFHHLEGILFYPQPFALFSPSPLLCSGFRIETLRANGGGDFTFCFNERDRIQSGFIPPCPFIIERRFAPFVPSSDLSDVAESVDRKRIAGHKGKTDLALIYFAASVEKISI
jgi:hypothetical protein